jgi:hypothetical protein
MINWKHRKRCTSFKAPLNICPENMNLGILISATFEPDIKKEQ